MAITRYWVPYEELTPSVSLATNDAVVVKFVDHLKDREAYANQRVKEAVGKIKLRKNNIDYEDGGTYNEGRNECIDEINRIKSKVLKETK